MAGGTGFWALRYLLEDAVSQVIGNADVGAEYRGSETERHVVLCSLCCGMFSLM
jgi:hypothetical protein